MTTWRITSRGTTALLLATLVTLGGCSAEGDQREGADQQTATDVAGPEVAQQDDASLRELAAPTVESAEDGAGADGTEQAVISRGTVSLRSGDVGRTRFEVQKRVDTLDGTIGDEETTTDPDGTIDTSRLVIRVPQERFDKAMTELAGLADLAGTTRTAEDVTTRVIDTAARIRAQEKSLQRIEVLLARAEEISEIVRIEAELTSRQATLDSLRSRQAWLADQTSLSTITVHIEHASIPVEDRDQDDRNAFLAGLIGGWHVLGDLGSGIALTAGAVLPFAAALLVLLWPARLVWRRFRPGGRPARTPSAA